MNPDQKGQLDQHLKAIAQILVDNEIADLSNGY